ncbi:MAG: SAM-dependent methyltransferase [Ponticaulis sp.]|nr:SAM-dependent methyltransferase [Ponticaulis sp.]
MMSNTPQSVFNRQHVRSRRSRASSSYQQVEFIKSRVLEDIEDRILSTGRKFSRALCLGGYSEAVETMMAPYCETLITTDFSASRLQAGQSVAVDEEWLPFAEHSFDLIISPLALHWVNDLPGTLIQIRHCLKPDGFFIAAMPGGASLHELRQVMLQAETDIRGGADMRVSPFADALDMSGLLQRAGFTLPVSDRDRLTIRYDNIFKLFQDLQNAGETHAPDGQRNPLSQRILMRAAELYQSEFADADGRIRATLDLVWMTGWSPHDSQPKPKRPGSARASLAEALGTKERSAGETTGRLKGTEPKKD